MNGLQGEIHNELCTSFQKIWLLPSRSSAYLWSHILYYTRCYKSSRMACLRCIHASLGTSGVCSEDKINNNCNLHFEINMATGPSLLRGCKIARLHTYFQNITQKKFTSLLILFLALATSCITNVQTATNMNYPNYKNVVLCLETWRTRTIEQKNNSIKARFMSFWRGHITKFIAQTAGRKISQIFIIKLDL